jgi:hypothetical protein
MKPKSPLGTNKTNDHAMQGRWQEMNRRQRRETMRKIQSEDLSLEVIHRNAAGIDIGNESHYVAVPRAGTANRYGATGALPAS